MAMEHAHNRGGKGLKTRSGAAWLSVLIAGLLGGPLLTAKEWTTAPAPDWVRVDPPPDAGPPPENQIEDGVYYLSVERQTNVETEETYRRHASRILNDTGVQGQSAIEIVFDPAYQRLTVHGIQVLRDGVILDKLNPDAVRILNREENLDSHLLDGSLTFYQPIDDVRIGDIVDYSYTVAGFNPAFHGQFFGASRVGWSTPIARFLFRVLAADSRKMTIQTSPGVPEAEVRTVTPGITEWRWEQTNLPAILSESNVPAWFDAHPVIRVSEMQSWEDVANWATGLYELDGPLGPAENEALQKLNVPGTSEEDRVAAALTYVQENVRYLGIEMGQGSYQPNPGETVLTRRFGDCKDKTQLLVRLLRAMKIDAVPVLVNTGWERGVADFPPSPIAFDHVICRVGIRDKTYWLDPTKSPQRGVLKNMQADEYGFGLPVSSDTTRLEPQTIDARTDTAEVAETFTFQKDSPVVDLDVRTSYFGDWADWERNYSRTNSLERVGRSFQEFYANRYPDIELLQPVEFEDFPLENRVEVREKYRITQFWTTQDNGQQTAKVYPQLVRNEIPRPDSVRRIAPYALPHPLKIVQDIELRFAGPRDVSFSDDDVKTDHFHFVHKASQSGNTLRLRYEYETLRDHVAPAEVADYRKSIDQVISSLGWTFTESAPGPSNKEWQPNILMFMVWFAALAFGAGVVVLMILFRKSPPPLVFPEDLPYQGLGGWLVLVQLGLWVRPISYTINLTNLIPFLDQTQWDSLTAVGQAAYHPAWAGGLAFETSASLFLLVLHLAAIVFFYQRRWIAPRLLIGLLAANAAFLIIDQALTQNLPGIDPSPRTAVNSLIATLIWIPYLLMSRRVRATFTRP